MPVNAASELNQTCFCIGTDVAAARATLDGVLERAPEPSMLGATHASLFSDLPVFISQQHLEAMRQIVLAIGVVSKTPAWRQAALQNAPAIAHIDPGYASAFTAYDFHLDDNGPHLIEINTNAGGALLCATASRAILRSASAPANCLQSPVILSDVESAFIGMFVKPFHERYPGRPLRRIAIVDDLPTGQYLYPEFLLFRELFQKSGFDAEIVDARALAWDGSDLLANGRPVDVIYNRLTDFYFEQPEHVALRDAQRSGQVLITPHPHGHAMLANKHNLSRLTDDSWLSTQGVDPAIRQVLLQRIPETRAVSGMPADWWWEHRAEWFFKPACGFGSKGTFRGSKMTRRVFNDIMTGDYIAQRFVAPSLRRSRNIDETTPADLKVDFRCFADESRILLVAARLYQGQTTNFRTAGGGFAPVFVPDCPPAN